MSTSLETDLNIWLDWISENSTEIEYLSIQKCRSNYSAKLEPGFTASKIRFHHGLTYIACLFPRLQRAPMATGSPGSLRRIQSCVRPGNKVRALYARGALREHPDVPTLDGQVGVHVQDWNWLTWSKTDRCSQEAQRLGLKDIQISNALNNDFKKVNKIWETRFTID